MGSVDIGSKGRRSTLPARNGPYWHRLRKGCYVGYRTTTKGGEGTWHARYRDEDGRQTQRELDIDADAGREVFDLASKEAIKWFDELDRGIKVKGDTVTDVCVLYVKNRRAEVGDKNANDAAARFRRLVDDAPIGRLRLDKLKAADVEAWRNDQLPGGGEDEDDDEPTADDLRRTKDSINRNMSALKAALNYAFRSGLVGSDAAWRSVKAFDGVGQRRKRILDAEQRATLLEHCDEHLRTLCTILLLTAARPGEIVNATVADLDKKKGTLALDGKTGPRVVTLSTAAVAALKQTTKNRIAASPLVPRYDGGKWDRFLWRDLFTEARKKAKLPSDVVMYTLRHTAISEMLMGGINPSVVAKLAGTSTAMIDKHYGHLIHDGVRDRLDTLNIIAVSQ